MYRYSEYILNHNNKSIQFRTMFLNSIIFVNRYCRSNYIIKNTFIDFFISAFFSPVGWDLYLKLPVQCRRGRIAYCGTRIFLYGTSSYPIDCLEFHLNFAFPMAVFQMFVISLPIFPAKNFAHVDIAYLYYKPYKQFLFFCPQILSLNYLFCRFMILSTNIFAPETPLGLFSNLLDRSPLTFNLQHVIF